jgi:methyltransferase (TIGR00027 family)
MEANQFSRTSLVTAYIRAYHAAHDDPKVFDDFLAHRLITTEDPQTHRVHLLDSLPSAESFLAEPYFSRTAALPWWIKVIAGAVLSRARYVEDCLEQAVGRGAQQYVILGAGMDTFAFRRLDLLGRLQVFEVDHPETQAFKRQRLAAVGLEPPPALHFLPADLERENLASVLQHSSYDPNRLTFVGWMGVTYYLELESVFATWRDLAEVAPAGSSVVFDYLDTAFFAPENPHKSVRAVLDNVRRIGEPMRTGFDPPALALHLARLGFRLQEDLSASAIEARYFRERTDGYHAGHHIHFAWAAVR